jgi:Leucine-rich repeat (LRR) protein
MTIYDIPFTVCQSVPNSLSPKTIKSGISVTGIRQCNSDIFIDEDLLSSALNVRQRQDKKQKSTILEVSVSNSEVSSHSSISISNEDRSTSKTNEHQPVPVDISSFPKRSRKSKSRVSVILTHIPVKDTFTETKGKS